MREKGTPNLEWTPPEKNAKKESYLSSFVRPGAPKLAAKWTPKSEKIDPGPAFSKLEKQLISISLFFSIVRFPGEPGLRKYSQNAVLSFKIGGARFFDKKHTKTEKGHPGDLQRDTRKQKYHQKVLPRSSLKNNPTKNTKNR